MRLPFGSRSHDVEQLRATMAHLAPTTNVAGIAAALAWPERRAEHAVREWERLEPMRVAYDPLSRTVRRLGPEPAAVSAPTTAVPGAAPPAPGSSASVTAAPPPPPKTWTAPVNCRSCGTPMEATGTGSGLFCPSCGRLSSYRSATAPPPLPTGPRPATTTAPAVETGTGHAVSDRKAQEMFAAWATAGAIPCPRCRAALRHDGVGKYRCSACGESVRFLGENGVPATAPAAPTMAKPVAPPAA
jgi:predicted RNA-binding Zn-ribbon protein involved in translation (DUF1610 family)